MTPTMITIRKNLTIVHLEHVSSIAPLEVTVRIATAENNINKQKSSTIIISEISERLTLETEEKECDYQH